MVPELAEPGTRTVGQDSDTSSDYSYDLDRVREERDRIEKDGWAPEHDIDLQDGEKYLEHLTEEQRHYEEALIDKLIENGVTVHDYLFKHLDRAAGAFFTAPFIEEQSHRMGEAIVEAFHYHDTKEYDKSAEAFGYVYDRLFDIDEDTATKAGMAYTNALIYHDIIEDGQDAVLKEFLPDVIKHFLNMTHFEDVTTAADIEDHINWTHVEDAFGQVAERLGLPESYATHQTDFFKCHTVVNESYDFADGVSENYDPKTNMTNALQDVRNVARKRKFARKSGEHALEAQKIKFGELIDDEDVVEQVGKLYLKAVDSHDAHSPQEDARNMLRMADVYQVALEQQVTSL